MRSFKPMILALATAVAAFTGNANAQDYSIGWDPRSGDVWVDNYLGDVNRYGSRYRDPFVDELVRYHGAPADLRDQPAQGDEVGRARPRPDEDNAAHGAALRPPRARGARRWCGGWPGPRRSAARRSRS